MNMHRTHPAFYRCYNAVEALILSSGKDSKKLEDVWLNLFPLTNSDFNSEKERELFHQIMEFYNVHPPSWRSVKVGDTDTIIAGNTHWRRRKELKKKILRLFMEIVRPTD